jgi:flagellar hook assembly protein FlgD
VISTLVDRTMQSGKYTVNWEGTYGNGLRAPTGNYMVHFRTGTVEKVKMVILIK